jgi:hypothetical protein
VLAGANRVLLGRQTESVPAHGTQDIEAEGAAVAGEDVGSGVTFRMADMQAGAGRIRKHVQEIIFGRQLTGGDSAAQAVTLREGMFRGHRLARVPGAKGSLGVPKVLPFGFDEMERVLSSHVS